jgi:hypothetical protein
MEYIALAPMYYDNAAFGRLILKAGDKFSVEYVSMSTGKLVIKRDSDGRRYDLHSSALAMCEKVESNQSKILSYEKEKVVEEM